ncbi:phosphotransferase [Microlunatus soli]|uniref:phosphotransferase n=1 Tax=Microlunatus soli TaxID=630515 RepID=UPI000B858FC7|nr:phosphotransferase [Microlunatus soli]
MSVAVRKERIPGFILHTYGMQVVGTPGDLSQGVHSTAYLIRTDDGDWVVKISSPDSDPPDELALQCAVYDFLNDQGLHAPVVLADRYGRRVGSIEGSDGVHYPVTVMRHHRLRRLTAESIGAADLHRVAGQVGGCTP